MTEMFLAEFVKDYGLKEGIILSMLCDIMNKTDTNEFVFTLEDLVKRFNYLTEKQIRIGILNLINQKGIRVYEYGERNFSRTLYYTIDDKVSFKYLKILSKGGAKMKKKTTAGV